LDFAERPWLEKEEIFVFQHLVSLVGGEDFLVEVYRAIARQRGVCVFPVVVPEIKVHFARLPYSDSLVPAHL